MRLIALILCCLFYYSSSLSQVVTIVDSTGQAVPYATVEIPKKKIALFANGKGSIDLSTANISANDELLISSIGFKPLFIAKNKIAGKVILDRQIKQLTEVFAFNGKWKRKNWGTDSDQLERNSAYPFQLLNGPGEQVGRLIYPGKSTKGPVFIEKISFLYILADSSHAPVRLRVYHIDEKEMPGGDLLMETVIQNLDKDKGWVEFDLSETPLKMPAKGVFIAVEFFDTDSAFWHKDTNWTKIDSMGKSIRYTQDILGGGFRTDDAANACQTYIRENGEWIRKDQRWAIKPFYCNNLVVKVWVKYPKQD